MNGAGMKSIEMWEAWPDCFALRFASCFGKRLSTQFYTWCTRGMFPVMAIPAFASICRKSFRRHRKIGFAVPFDGYYLNLLGSANPMRSLNFSFLFLES